MKSKLMIIALLILSAIFGACGGKQAAQNPTVSQQATKADQRPTSHLCGAITKRNKPCTRKVTNGDYTDTAVEAKCWQHQAQ